MEVNVNKIKTISSFVREDIVNLNKYNDSLSFACGISSWHLMSVLKNFNFKAAFVYGYGHCWVETDNYVIDITATQFINSLPNILITNTNSYYRYSFVPRYSYKFTYNTSALNYVMGWDFNVSNKIVNHLKRRQRYYRQNKII